MQWVYGLSYYFISRQKIMFFTFGTVFSFFWLFFCIVLTLYLSKGSLEKDASSSWSTYLGDLKFIIFSVSYFISYSFFLPLAFNLSTKSYIEKV